MRWQGRKAMTIFQKIIDGEIPADIVFDDERVLAFRDINPQAPVHILVIPKKPITGVAEMSANDADLMGHVLWVAQAVAASEGLADSGYRLVINQGVDGGQTVHHVHVHILGGRALQWPPG
jgi:histidine triad (HIT) family protein